MLLLISKEELRQFCKIEEESTSKRMEKVYQKAVQVVTRVITCFKELTKFDQWGKYLDACHKIFLYRYQYLIMAMLSTARLSYLELPICCEIR